MHILTLTSLFPNALQPVLAVFVRARMENFTRRFGHRWTVVAPVPWFPRLPFPVSPRYDAYARVPYLEEDRGYPVYHPRYLVTPRWGMRHYGRWMARAVAGLVRDIHARHPIDAIDGHYLYPDGSAAAAMGEALGIPVILSARGTDLNVFPSLASIRPLIESNLRKCRTLVCVSRDLKSKALELGVPERKVAVIGNGVDASLFNPGDADHPGGRQGARRRLGLRPEGPLLLSVGNLVEGKGFQIVLEAMAGLSRRDVRLAVAGHGPLRAALEASAARLGLADQVTFLGALPNRELPEWFRAADVFVLATAREGWPNVVTEAQACGAPTVATRVSGIPEIVTDPSLGLLVGERTPEAFRRALEEALAFPWDREHIARAGGGRTWDAVSEELSRVFQPGG